MSKALYPAEIPNWIEGKPCSAASGEIFEKLSPSTGKPLCRVTKSGAEDVNRAVEAAKSAQPKWADTPPVQRGLLLHTIADAMETHHKDIAEIVASETGKSFKDAFGETGGAIQCALFYAGEGQRLYARTTTSGTLNKYASTIHQPVGIAGLIAAHNTPIANVSWKLFPALICGNAVVMKAAKDTPITPWFMAKIAQEAGLPEGLFNVIQGPGETAGAALVAHPDVRVISFTGSTEVGKYIQRVAGERLAKVSLELGGKNPLVVCDDADLENAAKWVVLSAFSNAGQRCASTSRVIIFESIYEKFRDMLVEKTKKLKVGSTDEDDLGPVINENQLNTMIDIVARAKKDGSKILVGGKRLFDPEHKGGFFMAPTLIENTSPHSEISMSELFGPVACLYRAKDFTEALALANDSPYGLTACIHTRSIHRATMFTQKVQAGVAVVNAGTYGSEPHMPFGGVKQSGNGWREPGTEALDIYSDLKDIYLNIDPAQL
jgi:alpha-ketoglutaric semialdehyde dehydrogenase